MKATDFKIAVRNILRNKVHSSISILGLGIGLGCIIVLMALLVHETSFDKFIPDYRNVNRILFGQSCNTPFPLAEEMKKDFPEVKEFFRYCQGYNIPIKNEKNELVLDQDFGFADTSIYKILGIKPIAGTSANTISEIAISERTALKYFGNKSPLGSILQVKINNNELVSLSVCGIYKELPPNSTLYPQFIANIRLSEKLLANFQNQLGEYGAGVTSALNWDNAWFFSYVVLDKNCDKKALASKMVKYKELLSKNWNKDQEYSLQPVSEIYLGSSGLTGGNQFYRTGNPNELKYYWAISFMILLISLTNYIFLTRAATSQRLRELGTRKILGASRGILRKQILLESMLVTILSLIPATFVIDSGMTFINNTLNRTLSNAVFTNPLMWLLLVSVVIFTGTTSGLLIGSKISRIPSLVLLSGKTSDRYRSKKWNYSFLIFHFSIYIILVVSVLTVIKQINYSQSNLKGIDPKNILVCDLNSAKLQASFTTICNEMEMIPGVIKVAGSSFIPPFNYFLPITLANPEGEKVRFDGLIMGERMTELLDIDVIEGEPFGKYQPVPMDVLFNESGAKEYNIKVGDNYLGVFHVRGIVRDFNSHSLHTLIQPMVIIQQNPEKMGLVAIKTDGTNDNAVIKRLREVYTQIAPDEYFEVNHLTDQLTDFYSSERNQARIMGAFSILATVLAIMGLFGIALISISGKTKEIGLRKVNGSSVIEVIYLLNKNFVIWVFGALIVGIPASYYLMSTWQNRFAYKTELSWWIFALASLSAILIAVLTVSWQSWRAATRNPVKALRYE
ncbi:MAG TPA: FtsX-like permease family protein [Bacteroidales bacterium]|nr:FtsX-like permease family protein [Bacteroidales bacterium]